MPTPYTMHLSISYSFSSVEYDELSAESSFHCLKYKIFRSGDSANGGGRTTPHPSPSYALAGNRSWKQLTARERNVNTVALLEAHARV
jgi:hypothetical protein